VEQQKWQIFKETQAKEVMQQVIKDKSNIPLKKEKFYKVF